jgi:hypothetical protein
MTSVSLEEVVLELGYGDRGIPVIETLSELAHVVGTDPDPDIDVELMTEIEGLSVGDSIELSLVAITPVKKVEDDEGYVVNISMLLNSLLVAIGPVSLDMEDERTTIPLVDDGIPVPIEGADPFEKYVDEEIEDSDEGSGIQEYIGGYEGEEGEEEEEKEVEFTDSDAVLVAAGPVT